MDVAGIVWGELLRCSASILTRAKRHQKSVGIRDCPPYPHSESVRKNGLRSLTIRWYRPISSGGRWRTARPSAALARARPGQIFYSSAGPGTVAHLAGELLNSQANIKLVHVPYKGVAPATVDAIAGHVQMTVARIPVVI